MKPPSKKKKKKVLNYELESEMIHLYLHGWEHKISKSRQTQATGGKNCEKAGKLPRLYGDIYNTVVHDYSGTIPITGPYENSPLFLLYKPY